MSLQDLRLVAHKARGAKKIRLRDLQSLLGKLNFACRIIPMGRVFCLQLSLAMAGVSVPSHFACLSTAFRDDLDVWAWFLEQYNGRSLLLEGPMSTADLELYTDASGALGFGAFFQGEWCVPKSGHPLGGRRALVPTGICWSFFLSWFCWSFGAVGCGTKGYVFCARIWGWSRW